MNQNTAAVKAEYSDKAESVFDKVDNGEKEAVSVNEEPGTRDQLM